MVGGCPGHSSHDVTVFGSRRTWILRGGLQSILETQVTESLGVSHEGQRSLRRLDVL